MTSQTEQTEIQKIWRSENDIADLIRYRSASSSARLNILVLGGGPVGLLMCNMLLRTIDWIEVTLVERPDVDSQKQILFINENLINVNGHDDLIRNTFRDIIEKIKENACSFPNLPPFQQGFCCQENVPDKTMYFDTHHSITLHLKDYYYYYYYYYYYDFYLQYGDAAMTAPTVRNYCD